VRETLLRLSKAQCRVDKSVALLKADFLRFFSELILIQFFRGRITLRNKLRQIETREFAFLFVSPPQIRELVLVLVVMQILIVVGKLAAAELLRHFQTDIEEKLLSGYRRVLFAHSDFAKMLRKCSEGAGIMLVVPILNRL